MNPYAPLIKYGLIALAIILAVGWYTHAVYQRGEASVQAKWDEDKAQQIIAAKALADKQTADTAKIRSEYERQLADLRSAPPAVIHDRVVQYVRGLCNSAAPANSPASVPSGASGLPDRSTGDAAVRSADDDALQHDIESAQRNKAALKYCLGWVNANGGAVP